MAASKPQALEPPGWPQNHIANFADFSKPPEMISYAQQMAVTCTGLIWSRYSLVIIPKNWNLFSVNVAMAGTGLYQLTRKMKHDYFSEGKQLLKEIDDKNLSGPT